MEILNGDYLAGAAIMKCVFTFHPTPNDRGAIQKIPVFSITMPLADKSMLAAIKNHLMLRNKIYEQGPITKSDGYRRHGIAFLLVRDVGQLKNNIVPFFYKKLQENKYLEFQEWINKIGEDGNIPKRFKIIYKLYKSGFYDKI